MSEPAEGGISALPAAQVQQADRVCDRFEAAWRAGPRPTLEDYVQGVPEPQRSALLHELIPLDADYRRRAGETIQAADYHPRFPELRGLMNSVHVRALGALLAPAGVALLVTDMTSSQTYPLAELPPDADLRRVMDDLLAAGNLIAPSHPGLLSSEVRRDPALRERFTVRTPVGPWLWRNGPSLTFLVYALELIRVA